jgi:hypothetical protein
MPLPLVVWVRMYEAGAGLGLIGAIIFIPEPLQVGVKGK